MPGHEEAWSRLSKMTDVQLQFVYCEFGKVMLGALRVSVGTSIQGGRADEESEYELMGDISRSAD